MLGTGSPAADGSCSGRIPDDGEPKP